VAYVFLPTPEKNMRCEKEPYMNLMKELLINNSKNVPYDLLKLDYTTLCF
jgi:hypothetical protein